MGVAIKIPLLRRGRRDDAQKDEGQRRTRKPVQRAAPDRGGKEKKRRETVRQGKPQQVKGATRKVKQAVEKPTRSYAWLNRILILLGAGVVLVAGLQAWVTLQSIPVEQITVSGELEHTRTSEVQEMVQPALAGGFLGADLQQVREQLEALPWIYEATVRRVWPNALEIHVVEQLPIARWGESSFLNHEGQVFRPSNRRAWQSLPMLQGPEGAAGSLMASYQRMVDMLTPLGLGVEQLVVDERGQLQAVLGGGQKLMLGGGEFLERMHRFSAVYRAELASRMEDVERIDLRYERGVAVAFRESLPEIDSPTTSKEA